MTTITQMKCACPDCLCIVNLNDAVMKEQKPYCSQACANGHTDGGNCAQSSCGCH
ncbi:metallothionein [filamentous cyanobacterium LEGE 11480]|uniref:Metallothionein n=1 Tax=Romeriopsis navalis LEGE 11480 TaxID=2777977 RepID=A0A928VJK9_9CYAN|nr:metallothionein [Romeriopsis navalis]MBE9028928.1 metallothionein [Romeriopsis navalis LEGE 11480]